MLLPVLAIVGSAVLIGFVVDSLYAVAIAALSVGIALNAYLLVRVALAASRNPARPTFFLGVIAAGLYDAAKVFVLALGVRWLVTAFQ